MNQGMGIAPKIKGAINLAGLEIHCVDIDDLHVYIKDIVTNNQKAIISNVNIHCCVLAFQNKWLRAYLNRSQAVFCDGDGVIWGAQLLGENSPPKVPFTRWIWPLGDFCAKEGYKLYLLGGKPGIAEEAARRMKEHSPGLQIVGARAGYFEKKGPENNAVINDINESGANLLIVCFGMPFQEEWLQHNSDRLNVNAFLPAGGVLDYASGRLGVAPQWMLDMKLEWLFRIYEEPKRLAWRYMHDIPLFFLYIFKEMIKRTFKKKKK